MNKNIIKTISVGVLALAVFLVPAGAVLAASFNDHANDRETLRVKNSAGSFSTDGWGTSVSAQPGDTISFAIYYHNTASDDAQDTRVTLSPQSTGTSGSHTFTATVSADNAPSTSGSVSVFTSPQASLSFVSSSVQWYPNQTQSNSQALPFGQNGSEVFGSGLNIGTISGADHTSDFSAQGSVVLNFRVEGNTQGNAPSVTTNSATDIDENSAQLRASGNGNNSPTNVYFDWGTSASSLNNTTNSQSVGQNSFSTDRTIFGLSNNTTYFYRAVATNQHGSVTGNTRSFTTDSQSSQQPTVNLSANPSSIDEGDTTTISWSTNNAVSCSANASPHNSNWNGSVGTSGSRNISLNQDTTFNITCQNNQGVSTSRSRTVSVDDFDSNAPFISLFASPNNVQDSGDVTRLYWTTNNAVSCNAFASPFNGNWSGSIGTNGNRSVSVDQRTTFTLTCQNHQGFSTTRSATVGVHGFDNVGEPSATTNPATSISGTSAQLNGVVFPNGSNTRAYFQWGRTSSLGFTTTEHNVGSSGSREISRIISGLSPNTTYYYRVVARNNDGFTQGNIISFRTNNSGTVNPPVSNDISVVTNVPVVTGATSVRLNGLVFPNGNPSTGYFQWGRTQSLGNTTQSQSLGTDSVEAYSRNLTGLSPNTTYFVRAVAEGGLSGTVRGDILSFRTNSLVTTPPPTTGGPTVPAQQSLSVTKEVENLDNPNGDSESIRAERGDTIRFFITARNTGNTTLEDVELHDRIPAYVEFANSEGEFDSGEEREVVWILGDMQPGETENVELDVIITEDAPNITIENIARAESENSVTQNSNVTRIRIADNVNVRGAAAAFFGEGFFPDTLLGWLILVALILALVLLFRFLTTEMETRRVQRMSATTQEQESKKS